MLATSPAFKQNVKGALADAGLQKALAFTRPNFAGKRSAAVAGLPEFEALRDVGRDLKNHVLANLDFYLETWAGNVERAGGTVHWCSTADDARAAVLARATPPQTPPSHRRPRAAGLARTMSPRTASPD